MKCNEIVKAKNVRKESEHLFYQNSLKKSTLSLGTLILDVLCLKSGCLHLLHSVGLNCNYEPLLAFCFLQSNYNSDFQMRAGKTRQCRACVCYSVFPFLQGAGVVSQT